MTADQLGTLLGAGATAALALWRALHADKVASRVEAKADATAGGIDKRLEGGAHQFEALRQQNTAQGERIATLETLAASLHARLEILEARLAAEKGSHHD